MQIVLDVSGNGAMMNTSAAQSEIDMQTKYAVMNKQTNLLFAGFASDGRPTWTMNEREAYAYASKADARGQALLFVSFGVKAQQKPVQL